MVLGALHHNQAQGFIPWHLLSTGKIKGAGSGSLTIVASNSDPESRPYADVHCNGTNDQLKFIEFLAALPVGGQSKGIAKAGDYYFTIDSSADQVALSSLQNLEFEDGVRIHLVSGSGSFAAFLIDGQTTVKSNIKILGKPYIDAQQSGDIIFRVIGDVEDVELSCDFVHVNPDVAASTAVDLNGNTGFGIRRIKLDLNIYGAGFGSGNQDFGAVLATGSVKDISGTINGRKCSYVFSPQYVDYTPAKVFLWDESAGSYVDLTNAYDANVRTGATVDIDAGDHLVVGTSLPINSLFAWVGMLALNGADGYRWTVSGSGTNEYYLELSAGGDPSISQPYMVYENGINIMDPGTVGSLSAGEWDYGDNDTLGFSTLYVRLSSGGPDPDTDPTQMTMMGPGQTAAGFLVASIRKLLSASNALWTLSGSGTNEYYLTTPDGIEPFFTQNNAVEESGVFLTKQSSAGALAAGEWAIDNNDGGLSFQTLYVRLSDDSDPSNGTIAIWIEQPLTANDLPLTNHAPFERSGEVVWREPAEEDYIPSTLNGVASTYWIKLTPYNTGTSAAPTGLDPFVLNAIVGFRMPRKIDLSGAVEEIGATPVQSRGSHYMITRFNISNTNNHVVNHNSQDSVTLGAWDDRICKTRWAKNYGNGGGSADTQFLTRCAADGEFSGIDIAAWGSASIEQADCGAGSIIPWCHKTSGYHYMGSVHKAGRMAMRLLGDDCNIKLEIIGAGYDHTLADNSADRVGIRLRKQNFTTAPTGNFIDGCLIRGELGRMRYGILADADCDLPNYIGTNVILNASVSPISDLGGALVYVGKTTGTYNSGTGSIANAATSAVITHGLTGTPSLQKIHITLGEDPSNSPGAIWVDTITSTQFTVHCENDPGASNLDFGWEASL